jgi:hypothetical protein
MREVVDPLKQLVVELGVSLAQSAKLDVDPGQNRELWRAEWALNAVNTFLRECGVKAELRQSLMDLQAALGDVGEGRNNALLVVQDGARGRPTGRTVKDRARMPLAAALVTILAEAEGKSMKEQAAYVEGKFGIEGLFHYRKNLTGKKLSPEEYDLYFYWLREVRDGEINMPIRDLIKVMAKA